MEDAPLQIDPVEALDQELTSLLADISDTAHRIRALVEHDLPGKSHATKMTLVDQYELTARSEVRLMGDVLAECASARRARRVMQP